MDLIYNKITAHIDDNLKYRKYKIDVDSVDMENFNENNISCILNIKTKFGIGFIQIETFNNVCEIFFYTKSSENFKSLYDKHLKNIDISDFNKFIILFYLELDCLIENIKLQYKTINKMKKIILNLHNLGNSININCDGYISINELNNLINQE